MVGGSGRGELQHLLLVVGVVPLLEPTGTRTRAWGAVLGEASSARAGPQRYECGTESFVALDGRRRAEVAESGIDALRDRVDTLIVIENDRLLQVVEKQTSVMDAFTLADDVLRQGVQGITDLITIPGLVNLDFADVRTIMRDAGSALMGSASPRARTGRPRPRVSRSPRRCSSRRSRARPASCSTSPAQPGRS
jgi:cell division protein FtsZ